MADIENRETQGTSPPEDLLDRLIRMAQEETPPTQTSQSPTPSPSDADANATQTSGTPVGGGLLGGLLSNPAMLQALPQLMSSLGPLLSGGGQKTPSLPAGHPSTPTPASSTPASPTPASSTPKAKVPVDRHTALLCAIKPYLGRERQQAAEQMINLCRVWSTLQGMGISLPMLMSAFTGGNQGNQGSQDSQGSLVETQNREV